MVSGRDGNRRKNENNKYRKYKFLVSRVTFYYMFIVLTLCNCISGNIISNHGIEKMNLIRHLYM